MPKQKYEAAAVNIEERVQRALGARDRAIAVRAKCDHRTSHCTRQNSHARS